MLEKVKNSRFTMKLFSLALAIALWLVITYTVNPTITQQVNNIPVSFAGETELAARGLVLINKKNIDSVNAKIRGARSSVINALSTISATIDVSDITSKGSKTEDVSVDIGVSGVSITGRFDLSVTLTVDELVEKEVPVRVLQSGSEKNKQMLVLSESESKKITLRGAKSELEKISAAEVSVDISGLESELTRELSYILVNADNAKISCETLVNPPETVAVTSHIYPRKTVAVKTVLAEGKDEYELTVKSQSKDKIDVGISEGAENITELYATFEPEDFRVGQDEYTVELNLPEGVHIPEESKSVTVKLSLEKKLEREVRLDIEVRNMPSGYSARAAAETVSLLLRGTEGALSGNTVKAYVDASGLSEGHYELPVRIESTDAVTLEENAHIGVTITK